MLQSYNVYFGRGITSELKQIYLTAKQKGKIITNLTPGAKPASKSAKTDVFKNWEPELAQLTELASKLKGGAGQPPLHTPAFSLVKASLEFAKLAVEAPIDADKLEKCLNRIDRAFKQAENTLYRME